MSEPRRERPLVLVADDEPDNLDLVRFLLDADGFEVMEAADGEQALALVEQRTPDVAVLDIMMPGIDGIELIDRLRARPETAQLPIVVLTAWLQDDQRARARRAGADAYVGRPFDLEELSALVRRFAAEGRPPTPAEPPEAGPPPD